MASSYDGLDATKELEQRVASDLHAALRPRGCVVKHNGSPTMCAGGGQADIEVRDPRNNRLLLVEVTKRRGAASDGEFAAMTAHLESAVDAGGFDDYSCLYVSPQTSARMSTNILNRHNRLRDRDGRRGRIMAVDFDTFEAMIERFVSSDPRLYPTERFEKLFARWAEATDDARARTLVADVLFEEDTDFREESYERRRKLDAENEQWLRKAMDRLENRLRENGVTGDGANVNLIYLTFIRLYQEKRQQDLAGTNHFTGDAFIAWREALPAQVKQEYGNRRIRYLLKEIATDAELQTADMISETATLHPAITDDLVLSLVLPTFDEYRFYGSALDVLGVVFETLARKSQKDTRVGQFFTPQEVVDFCADLVDLRSEDVVLDPAVGTSRFLIAAMRRMLALVPPGASQDKYTSVRTRQLLGVDLDDWVATIAKMNMFIHGDGKNLMVQGNGLILADRPVFATVYPAGVRGEVDAVLTNPPLGDTSYLVALDWWKRLSSTPPDEHQSAAYLESLSVVPLREPDDTPEQREAEKLRRRFDAAERRLEELRLLPETGATRRAAAAAERRRTKALDDLTELRKAPVRPAGAKQATGERRKGGALFLGAIAQYLRTDRLPSAEIEWQGGQAAIVVDEAILNTSEYADVREFIRREFFVKAVVSLGRTAFAYLAKTTAKTSILFLVKKPSASLTQREPVFFGHAEKCGFSSTGRWIGSDLPDVLDTFRSFERAIRGAYVGHQFHEDAADANLASITGRGDIWHGRWLPSEPLARLDFFDARFHDIVERLQGEGVDLVMIGDLIEPRPPISPAPSVTDEYRFASINRNLGTVAPKALDVEVSKYKPTSLWLIEADDVVVSGIDLVHGAVAVAGPSVDGLVMSKEMFPYRVKPGAQVLPEFVALLLRTSLAAVLIHGRVSGTSNRTRLKDPREILDVPIPAPPRLAQQEAAVASSRKAAQSRSEAEALMTDAASQAEALWKIKLSATTLAVETTDDEPEAAADPAPE